MGESRAPAKRPGVPRIILAGNNRPAIDVLDLLAERVGLESLLVLAPPGGPRHGWQASLSEAAAERGARCLTPEAVNAPEIVDAVRAFDADLLLSVYYTQLFRAPLLEAVRGPVLNYHPSLLPRHRGTAPVVHAIADGDAQTGVSVHHIDLGVDTGRLVWQRAVAIAREDTSITLQDKLGALVVDATRELVDPWLAGDGLPEAFDQTGEPNVHRSTDPHLNALDPRTQSRERIRNVIRALAPPLPGAHVEHGGERVVLRRAEPTDAPAREPGTIERDGDTLLVWATDGALRAEIA